MPPEEPDDMRPPLGGEAPTRDDYNRSLRRKSSQGMRDDTVPIREEPSTFAAAPRSPSEVYSPFHDFSGPADENETSLRFPPEVKKSLLLHHLIKEVKNIIYKLNGYFCIMVFKV